MTRFIHKMIYEALIPAYNADPTMDNYRVIEWMQRNWDVP